MATSSWETMTHMDVLRHTPGSNNYVRWAPLPSRSHLVGGDYSPNNTGEWQSPYGQGSLDYTMPPVGLLQQSMEIVPSLFLSHILTCDGSTVNPAAIDSTLAKHCHTGMRFPKEQPTNSDFDLWAQTIRRLTLPILTFSPSLGRFVHPCPEYTTWQTNSSHSYIVQQNPDKTYDIYYLIQ